MSNAMHQREGAGAEHMRDARDWRHEGVFDGAFPALHRDRLGDAVEDDAEERPDGGADGEVEDDLVDLRLGELRQRAASAPGAMKVTVSALTTLYVIQTASQAQ